jgi:protein TonB
MLAYAANRPIIGARKPAPNTMLAIIGIHVAAIAVLMSAKMELPPRPIDPPIKIRFIEPPKPPPTNPVHPERQTHTTVTTVDRQTPIPPTPIAQDPIEALGPTTINTGGLGGGGTVIIPEFHPSVHYPVKLGPRLATPESELKPPYPSSKLLTEEEAVLNLKLTIDHNGRVVAVDPVGRADPAFLAAARRHLLAHWRYKPASEDGRAVTSSTVITLRFELNG